MMKYLYLLVLSVLLIPIAQTAHAQNFLEEIGQAFSNLTSGMMGDNNTNQSSTNASDMGSSDQTGNQTTGSSDQNATDSGFGSIQELQNLTSGNQEILMNGSSIASNVSIAEGMEQSQLGEGMIGDQNATFEGNVLENVTSDNSSGNSTQ